MFWLHYPDVLVNVLHYCPEVLILLRSLHTPMLQHHILSIRKSETSTLSVNGNLNADFSKWYGIEGRRISSRCVLTFTGEVCSELITCSHSERMSFKRPPARHCISSAMGRSCNAVAYPLYHLYDHRSPIRKLEN